jgi:hypothetical protein
MERASQFPQINSSGPINKCRIGIPRRAVCAESSAAPNAIPCGLNIPNTPINPPCPTYWWVCWPTLGRCTRNFIVRTAISPGQEKAPSRPGRDQTWHPTISSKASPKRNRLKPGTPSDKNSRPEISGARNSFRALLACEWPLHFQLKILSLFTPAFAGPASAFLSEPSDQTMTCP